MKASLFKPIKQTIKAALQRLGVVMLAIAPLRRLANWAYNRLSQKFVQRFVKCFDESRIPYSFNWVYELAGKRILMPVMPDYQRSWNQALSCRWHEPEVRLIVAAFIANHEGPKLILDAGANHGLFSYPFLASGWQGVMFEPQRQCLDYIQRVVETNGFEVTVEQCLLSDRETTLEFYTSESTYWSSLDRSAVARREEVVPVQMKAVTLDSYCSDKGLTPGFIKIDVEGHEWPVIQGGVEVLTRHRPAVLVEVWGHAPHGKDLFNFMVERGYRAFGTKRASLPEICAAEELSEGKGGEFLFCVDGLLVDKIRASLREAWGQSLQL